MSLPRGRSPRSVLRVAENASLVLVLVLLGAGRSGIACLA